MPQLLNKFVDLPVITRSIILEGTGSLFLLAIVAAFVLGWKPKLTTLRVSIVGGLLIIINLLLLYFCQERKTELYIGTAFFLVAPIAWLAAYCKNRDRNMVKFLPIAAALWMIGLIEYGAVLKNYVTALSVPVLLIPCFQCWRNPKEEGFPRTSFAKWNWCAGGLCGSLTAITLMVAVGWENPMVTRYFSKLQFMLPISAVLMFCAKAIPEELVYRGIFQGALKDKYGIIPAIAGSTLLYGAAALNDPALWTFPNWHAAVNALILGIACGVVYHKTKSLAVSGVLNAGISFFWWALFAHGGY